MVTDQQARRLMTLMQTEKALGAAAAKAGMDEKTARKYRDAGRLPSELRAAHTWRTREDTFGEVWEEVCGKLEANPGLESKTLFEDLQRRFPGRFGDGQLRTLQRRVKAWRAVAGPRREVFFAQRHEPGELCQSDFTWMNALAVTIAGRRFDHLLYHFVLPYSNWETGAICFSESFESLSEGLQGALWELGGVPRAHRTDRLSTAVLNTGNPEIFTQRYTALLRHYGLEGRRIQARQAHENGDVEQRHYRFKEALDQALMLRGSREFADRAQYAGFVRTLFGQLNAGRRARLAEERRVLRGLPARRLEACQRLEVRVGPGSTIRVHHNVYSVDSRLIGEPVEVRLYVESLEVWHAQRRLETIERLRGEAKHRIQYRHVIDWLVRKPGAFEHYRYRDDLFPTSRFRMAYDALRRARPSRASRDYLRILRLAARESEALVDEALRALFHDERPITPEAVAERVRNGQRPVAATDVRIAPTDLAAYDALLVGEEGAGWLQPAM